MNATPPAVPPATVNLGDACHGLLARLAGRAPDGLLTESRRWLATHDTVTMAVAVASYAASARLPLAARDVALVRALLAGAGLGTATAAKIETIDGEPPLDHAFAPVPPAEAAALADRIGHCLDLTVPPVPGQPEGLVDELDIAAAQSAAAVPGAAAYWRAWRSPADAAPWPRPVRIHLLAVESGTAPYLAAAALQEELADLGERDPQVEAFALDDELPAYQRTARARGALLWTAKPRGPVRLASVYDLADSPSGAGFSPARARLGAAERERVAAYLAAGTLLLATTARLDDVLAPAAFNSAGFDPAAFDSTASDSRASDSTGRGRVPVNFRTDGAWVWSDAAHYYVHKHGVAPDPGLLEHIRAAGLRPGTPDALALFRALAALTAPAVR